MVDFFELGVPKKFQNWISMLKSLFDMQLRMNAKPTPFFRPIPISSTGNNMINREDIFGQALCYAGEGVGVNHEEK